MIRLVLADDHRMILEGLEQLFRREPDFEVVGTANNGEDAVAAVKRHRPDVLVLDVNMPRGDGMWVVRQLQPLKLPRSEEHTSELQSHSDLVCRLLLEK